MKINWKDTKASDFYVWINKFVYVLQGIEKEHLYPYLPDFLGACSQQLGLPDGPNSDCGMKMEILKVNVIILLI